ncbi:DUF4135 domain-containing protein [Undibacterium sp. CY18W]|uniref:DUF4135 domain-containing protein n=1 Tax=Undibacterium hunanense TaxID=2762292 RepID=A0ABR6ZYM1_9BURK|nr:DUF4135 domain-containing protein [Undibacterium hunanense]MBC3920859.1 DUF4135 domain-containing protein [Undibacterium hunanense]
MSEHIRQARKKMDLGQQHAPAQRQSAVQSQPQSHTAQLAQQDPVDLRPQFADQRQQTRQLKAYSHMMQNSPRATQLRAMQHLMNQAVLQKAEGEELLQEKSVDHSTTQLAGQSTAQPNNTGLPNQLKAGIESLSGMSMDHVRVNYNSDKPAQLNAHAYAQGSEIHVAPGQERHVPHEAWHVVQQAQGRVRPTMQMKLGVPVNDDAGLETEADVMGAKALGVGTAISGKVVQNKGVGNQRTAAPDYSAASAYSSVVMPYQLMKFERFQGWNRLTNWFQNQQEDELLAQEKRVKEFLDSMKPFEQSQGGEQISVLRNRFDEIEASTITTLNYATTLRTLKAIFYRLDNISSAITKTWIEYDRAYPLEIAEWIDKSSRGPDASRLVYLVCSTYSKLPIVLKSEKNKEVIKAAILGELDTSKIRQDSVKAGHLEFAQKRVGLLNRNFRKMLDRIEGDWVSIRDEYGLSQHLVHVHLTGSDYHNDGQSVCILESDEGKKVVYKPRTLSPDIHLEGGKKSVLSDLNTELATTKFSQTEDNKGEQYGYMEHITKAKRLTIEEAGRYYYQMGRMVIATKLLGVTDLHQENIYTSSGGIPVIVDAETSFLPDVMMSEAWNATLIHSTLTTFAKDGAKTPNYFCTDEEFDAWRDGDNAEDDETEPSGEYLSKVRTQSYEPGGKYNRAFLDGIAEGISAVDRNKGRLISYLQERVKSIHGVRIVPIATLDFKKAMQGVYREPETRDKMLGFMLGDAKQSLNDAGYVMAEGSDEIIKTGMIEDFKNTDFPIFRYEPSNDCVYYRGSVIAKHKPGIQAAIEISVNHISETRVKDVAKEMYLNTHKDD